MQWYKQMSYQATKRQEGKLGPYFSNTKANWKTLHIYDIS